MKNKNIFFSIICPIFNLENFIIPLINTIKNQSYKNFEIIFVNDGSTDLSLKLLKKNILNSKIKYKIINSRKNFGPGWARNKGIKLSNYEWIAFLDGDDLWHKDKLFMKYPTDGLVLKVNSRKFQKQLKQSTSKLHGILALKLFN